jgi:hypothetical protein
MAPFPDPTEQRGIKNKKPEITKLCMSFKSFLQHAEPCPAIHFVPAIEAAGVKFRPFPLLDDASNGSAARAYPFSAFKV